MSELRLDVWLDGFSAPVGKLVKSNAGDVAFAYDARYLDSGAAVPVSLSLPLTGIPASDAASRAFFDNLLQERDAPLRAVMDQHGIARSDIAGLLFHLGKDCAGALSLVPEGSPPAKMPGNLETDYDYLSAAEVSNIVRALHERRPLPLGRRDPSPLAGVQSKISLHYDAQKGFAIPKPESGAPSTLILKVPGRHHAREARLEWQTMNLARLCGFETPDTNVLDFDGIEALAIARFDRGIDGAGRIVRLHQEDFAQALSLPPSLKYERNGQPGRRFDVASIRWVLDQTVNPAAARLAFVRATVFDLLVGNVDAHAKNHALLHMPGNKPILAPRYDLVPTRLDRHLTDEFSYSIGKAKRLQDLTLSDIIAFLREFEVTGERAQKRILTEVLQSIADPLSALLDILQADGHKDYADMVAANIRALLPELGFPVPNNAQTRDAFIRGGGGWHTS